MTPQLPSSNRMGSLDALFLYLEKKDMPLHIGAVCIFDGPIPLRRLMKQVETRLPLVPRYQQRLVFPPLYLGHPTWEFDPDFDIRNHFRHVRLKTGTKDELEALAGERFGDMMDRSRPLWEITVVDGLEGGRGALIPTVHHSLVDGVAGVGLINLLLDDTPTPKRISIPKAKAPAGPEPPPLPNPATSAIHALLNSYSELLENIITAQTSALNVLQGLLAQPSIGSIETLLKLVPELPLLTPVKRLPFNAPTHGQRLYRWTEFSVAEMNEVRAKLGGKLNDVALALITRAVQRYAIEHGQSMKDRTLRVMAPVNLRRDITNPGMGNSISFLPITLPLWLEDPVELLRTVHRTTQNLKRAQVAEVVRLVFSCMGVAPTPLQAAFGQLGNILPIPPFNMVATNVQGPDYPLYALGRKMLTYCPYVPCGNEMGVCCAFETYDGNFYFGFSGDSGCAPDLGMLRDYLQEAYYELKVAAGMAEPQLQKPRRRSRPTRSATTSTSAEKPPAPGRSKPAAAPVRRPRGVKSRETAVAEPPATETEIAPEAPPKPRRGSRPPRKTEARAQAAEPVDALSEPVMREALQHVLSVLANAGGGGNGRGVAPGLEAAIADAETEAEKPKVAAAAAGSRGLN